MLLAGSAADIEHRSALNLLAWSLVNCAMLACLASCSAVRGCQKHQAKPSECESAGPRVAPKLPVLVWRSSLVAFPT